MKKMIYLIMACMTLGLNGCGYDDDDVWNAIYEQGDRIAALEAWQKTVNEDIAALKAIVDGNDFIKSVTPIVQDGETVGYTISFLRQGDVTINNGTKGEQGDTGDTPVISVEQQDGKWYWTLNGTLMKDGDGNPIPTTGTNGTDGTNAPTPILKAGSALTDDDVADREASAVYLSVDGGTTWTKVSGPKGDTGSQGPAGPAGSNGDSLFESVVDNGTTVTFTLSDETVIVVPKYAKLTLTYGVDKASIQNGVLNLSASDDFVINYVVGEPTKFSLSIDMVDDATNGTWSIDTGTAGQVKFALQGKGGSAALLMTLTAKDNETYFYKVKITASTSVAFNGLTANGSTTTATTDKLTLTFDKDIEGLIADDITLTAGTTSATKGALTRTGAGVYELAVSGITASGTVTVAVSKEGHVITPASKTVNVYYRAMPNLSGSVSISGTVKIGETITADISSLDGTGDVTYKWIRGESTEIGTNSSTYTLTDDDHWELIKVEVSRAGYNGTKTSSATRVVKYAVGDNGSAGIVFYINTADPTAEWKYIETAPADLGGTYQWAIATSPAYAFVTGTEGSYTYIGKENTAMILALDPNAPAAKACDDYSYGGYNDWYLPSRAELDRMIANKDAIGGGFNGDRYWSSTQYSNTYDDYAISITSDRAPIGSSKTRSFSVRPVRRF